MPTPIVERLVQSSEIPNADKPLDGQVTNSNESSSGKRSGGATPKNAQKQGDVGTSTRAPGPGLKPRTEYKPPATDEGRPRRGRVHFEGSLFGDGDDWLRWFRC